MQITIQLFASLRQTVSARGVQSVISETSFAGPRRPGPAILWQRQTTRGSSGLRRFVGENPPSGVQIYYSFAKKADDVALVIEDMSGNTLRELSTSNEAGLH